MCTSKSEGKLWVVQNKTNQHLVAELAGGPALADIRTKDHPYRAIGAWFVEEETGYSLLDNDLSC